MKPDRKKIHQKFGGKCAYCGCELKDETGKHMHVDHVEPIRRNWWSNDCLFPENNKEINLFPSCPKCNNYKSSMNIESFRFWIKNTPNVLIKITAYNNAVRFGLVKEIEWDGLFWFEKFNTK